MTRSVDLPSLLKSLLGLGLGEELLELLLGELRLSLGRTGAHRLRGSEPGLLLWLLLWLEKLLLLLLLLLLELEGRTGLLRLGCKLPRLLLLELLRLELLLLLLWLEELLLRLLWGNLSRLLLREKVGGEGINLTVLVVVPGESLQRNLLSGQLRQRDLSWLLGSLLLLRNLLRSPLELEGWVGLLWLGGELPWLLLLKLLRLLLKLLRLLELLRLLLLELLGILSKLLVLLELSLELVWLLLLLLEVPEVLLEVPGVELLRGGPAGVEVGRVEDRPPGALPGVGEVLSLGRGVVLLGDLLLLGHDGLLEGDHGLVSLLLQLEGGVGLLGGGLCLSERIDLLELQVGLEAGAVVGAVLHDLDLTVLVQEPILTFHIPFGILGL
jgi:hypothetical protein